MKQIGNIFSFMKRELRKSESVGKNGNWEDLRLFIAVARGGGLSTAARETGRSAATLGRRMLALERRLACDLFVRHERGYDLTSEGQALLVELLETESRIARIVTIRGGEGLPLVKVSAGTWTTMPLLAAMDDLLGSPPDLRLRFIASERRLDISRREAVIGFRNARPSEAGLAGRRLGRVDFAPYAREDAPERWIKVLSNTPSARWLDTSIDKPFLCEVSAPRNSLDLALAGKGIALLPTFVGDAQPGLRRRSGIVPELSHDQWLVIHDDDRHLPEVRRAIDRMIAVIGPGMGNQRL